MRNWLRIAEYKVLLYRIMLAYVFYFFARVLFCIYNNKILQVDSLSEFFRLSYYGIAFDTSAILYVNALFVVLSIFPFWVNTNKDYQKVVFYVYFICNLFAYVFNFVDFIYYKYTFSRTTKAVFDVLEHEDNLSFMAFRFLYTYWHVVVLFVALSLLWVFLYKKVKLPAVRYPKHTLVYFVSSVIGVLFFTVAIIGGIRGGDFKKSTRPINMVDASRHVKKVQHSDLVLNTPFAFLRTINVDNFKKVPYTLDAEVLDSVLKPTKQYKRQVDIKPNIVVFITESYGSEYIGAFNKNTKIKNYVSYTPFLDSLANHSMIYTNAHANGYKSIHGMSSVLSGIPSFKNAFTSTPFSKQEIESLISTLKTMDYDTSFFHGAPNGSMGFLGFSNILEIDNYYGKTEYNNDADFDGYWGIWDEPFFQFMKNTLDEKEAPFFSTIFTVTSHEPYIIPKEFEGKFPKGNVPMHQCVGYTDYAFKQFFEAAKKTDWYDNTIFIITADHCNQVYYDEYMSVMNRHAVPFFIFKPNSDLVGESDEFTQQIDIYPTILDLVGYNDSFRSWGRSVFDEETAPFTFNYNNHNYQLQRGNYICIFDGEKAIGFYNKDDRRLKTNLIQSRTPEMDEMEVFCKAFLKDYFDRILDRKL